MKNNETWMDRTMEGIGAKSEELKTVTLANKLYKEMENKTMEEVLEEHLPASDTDEIALAAQNMRDAVRMVYEGLDEQMTADQVKNHLNGMLDGLNCDQQGRWLVNLLNCSVATYSAGLEEDPRWMDLRDAESYQSQDVQELIDMAVRATENHAGFLARQEFSVMEHMLDRIPQTVVEKQMNSGAKFAEAYAAAMYIVSRQTSDQRDVHPYQMGLLAADCVESSRILAKVHCHKLEAEEAFPQLKNLVKQILVQSMAFALRLVVAYAAGNAVFCVMAYTCPVHIAAILAVTIGMAVAAFFEYSQEQAVETVTNIWEGVSSFVQGVISFFRGSGDNPSIGADAVTVDESEAVSYVPVNVDVINV